MQRARALEGGTRRGFVIESGLSGRDRNEDALGRGAAAVNGSLPSAAGAGRPRRPFVLRREKTLMLKPKDRR